MTSRDKIATTIRGLLSVARLIAGLAIELGLLLIFLY